MWNGDIPKIGEISSLLGEVAAPINHSSIITMEKQDKGVNVLHHYSRGVFHEDNITKMGNDEL